MPILTLLTFLPLFFALILIFVKDNQVALIKFTSALSAIFQLVIVIFILFSFDKSLNSYQFVHEKSWINLNLGNLGHIQFNYILGLDGLSFGLILLSAIVFLIANISSFNSIQSKVKGYYSMLLLLSSSVYGCFLALDLVLFFIFFEFMLLPMFFLIGIWGGDRREYASLKFFIYTLLGSVFILSVIIGLGISVINPAETAVNIGLIKDKVLFNSTVHSDLIYQLHTKFNSAKHLFVHTTDMRYMNEIENFAPNSLLSITNNSSVWGLHFRLIGFLVLIIGFLIKLPSVPFHTWLPDAHVEAPTPISVILAGILLKIGSYGMIRIAYTIFPEGAIYFAQYIAILGVISIIYAGLNALAMKDLKKMIAYSSVSHMGFILLGLGAISIEAVNGAIYQQFSHGLIASMLFLIVAVIYDRVHDRNIENFRGLASKMPQYATFTVIAFFASLGLPGFSGFIAEIFVFLGAFNSFQSIVSKWVVIIATLGLLIGAAYYLWALQRMYFGKYWLRGGFEWNDKMNDLNNWEKSSLIILSILIVIGGIFPQLFFDFSNQYVNEFVNHVSKNGLENLTLIKKVIQ